jgi:hypothetical protein
MRQLPISAKEWIGSYGIWHAKTRVQEAYVLVRVYDAREQFGRVDLKVEIVGTGSRTSVSDETVMRLPSASREEAEVYAAEAVRKLEKRHRE